MPPQFSIRPATAVDRPALLRFVFELNVFEAAFEPDRRTDTDFAGPTLDWRLRNVRDGDGLVLVATDSDDVTVGWMAAHRDEHGPYVRGEVRAFGYIAELYLVPEWRGRGVGRALIEAAKAHFRAQSLTHAVIGALAANAEALAAYTAQGFRPYTTELRLALSRLALPPPSTI